MPVTPALALARYLHHAVVHLEHTRDLLLAAEADGLLAGDDKSAVGYARADIGTALAELKPLLPGVAATPSPHPTETQ